MNKFLERKIRSIAYTNRSLDKQVMQFKKSLDEVAGVLEGTCKNKKKGKK